MSEEQRTKSQTILIIEPDSQSREELYNFLLSAGYQNVSATDKLSSARDRIVQSAYEIIVADAGSPRAGEFQMAPELAQLNPGLKIILMIKAEDQQAWNLIAAQMGDVRFLIRTTFAQNLLYLLDEPAQP
ncbi:MAG TPA: response regulator [Blastocatellia bacterium]|nr:response regulator [Blastocatellia bacterium]